MPRREWLGSKGKETSRSLAIRPAQKTWWVKGYAASFGNEVEKRRVAIGRLRSREWKNQDVNPWEGQACSRTQRKSQNNHWQQYLQVALINFTLEILPLITH